MAERTLKVARVQAEIPDRQRLRSWLEYVAQTAIDWLDDLDAAEVELEDDELGDEAAL